MSGFISSDLLHYLTRPLTEQEKEWRMADNVYKKTLLPPLTKGPLKTDVPAKGPQKPDLNKPAFLLSQGAATLIRDNRCPDCANKINYADFKNRIQQREYSISGKCFDCQKLSFPG
jgi:hypothetical protein